jgi:hypothetical protein
MFGTQLESRYSQTEQKQQEQELRPQAEFPSSQKPHDQQDWQVQTLEPPIPKKQEKQRRSKTPARS